MTQEQVDAYLAVLEEAHTDGLPDFLTSELHPHPRSKPRVSESGHGHFGYSYGDLLALYAGLRETGPFASIGAGSTSVAGTDNQPLTLVEALPELGGDTVAPRSRITLNELGLLGGIPFHRGTARNVPTTVEQLYTRCAQSGFRPRCWGRPHVTGPQASFLSYLRTCHAR